MRTRLKRYKAPEMMDLWSKRKFRREAGVWLLSCTCTGRAHSRPTTQQRSTVSAGVVFDARASDLFKRCLQFHRHIGRGLKEFGSAADRAARSSTDTAQGFRARIYACASGAAFKAGRDWRQEDKQLEQRHAGRPDWTTVPRNPCGCAECGPASDGGCSSDRGQPGATRILGGGH